MIKILKSTILFFDKFTYICNNIASAKLNQFQSYRQWYGAILFVVYLFIATPVSFWHHHTAGISATHEKVPGAIEQKSYHDTNTHSVTEQCSICGHHYAVYADDAISPVVVPPLIHTGSPSDTYAYSNYSFLFETATNRGPPSSLFYCG
jgi:hypothetical protein